MLRGRAGKAMRRLKRIMIAKNIFLIAVKTGMGSPGRRRFLCHMIRNVCPKKEQKTSLHSWIHLWVDGVIAQRVQTSFYGEGRVVANILV